MKKITSVILVLGLLFSLFGCYSYDLVGSDRDLMRNIQPRKTNDEPVSLDTENEGLLDFAIQLFRGSFDQSKNTMISPVSVLYALAMTANGAKGETLSQMESTLGMSVPEFNAYLKAYMDALPVAEKYKLNIANSIWLTDDGRFTVVDDFLQTNADYYGAGIFKVPFDSKTCKDINKWVEENTDSMIKDILNEIPPDAVMYLVNAMAFDAEWQRIYAEHQIRDGIFNSQSGEKQEAEMMYSEEHYYLEDGSATGFMKHYADSKYAFVAMLPNEDISIEDYVSSLCKESVASLFENVQNTAVNTVMPKFESEYSVEMSEILTAMGMKDAFDGDKADFTGLGTSSVGNIFISRVLHKTYIAVDEKGTKAGAATVVETFTDSAYIDSIEKKEVVLDRPFVYMIVDCEANLPLFIGTLMSIE